MDVFVDGSYDPASSSGGWAFVAYEGGGEVHSGHGQTSVSSNNTAELLALYQAVRWINTAASGLSISIWTDSFPTVEGCNRWRLIWRNNGWRRIDRKPRSRKRSLPDAELWQALDAELAQCPQISINWCKGHSGSPGNERADALARAACFGSVT
jgi:ribonuclease HI